MKISHVHIENFRGIKKADIDLSGGMNVVFGINGAGKTTIVEALTILFSWFAARMINPSGRGIQLAHDHITHGKSHCLLTLTLDNGVSWSLARVRRRGVGSVHAKTDLNGLNEYINQLYGDNEVPSEYPFFRSYSVNRVVDEIPLRLAHSDTLQPMKVYSNVRSSSGNFRKLFEWLRERSDIENAHIVKGIASRDNQLEAVRNAICRTLPEFQNLEIERSPRALMIEKNGERFNFADFSDGEKCYLSLVGDIARWLAIANPHMDDPLQGSAIFAIDEIDLHMHVQWQQQVVEKLLEVFPNCQFIVTSHSPQVFISVNTFNNDKVFTVSGGEVQQETTDTYGYDHGDALVSHFHVGLYNRAVDAKLAQFSQSLADGDYAASRDIYQWLCRHLNPSDRNLTACRIEFKRRGIEYA